MKSSQTLMARCERDLQDIEALADDISQTLHESGFVPDEMLYAYDRRRRGLEQRLKSVKERLNDAHSHS